jgi:hypothetical protein
MKGALSSGDAAVGIHRASSYSGSVEEMFGWLKTVALFRKTRHRGVRRVGWLFILGLFIRQLGISAFCWGLSRLETSSAAASGRPTPGASVWGQGERYGGLPRGPRGKSDAKARRLCYRLAAWSVPRGTSVG